MKKEIIILGVKCTLEFGYYPNHTVGITAYHNGEPQWTCTVNWEANWEGMSDYKKVFKFPCVVIKGYSENEGMADALEKAGVVKLGAYMAGTQGTVQTAILTDEWQEIAKQELKKMEANY